MKTTLITEKEKREAEVLNENTIKLSIHADGVEHLMGTLSNLYARPAEAVFREYVSNALDSHLLAGQTKPIDVKLTLHPFNGTAELIVQDFGVGMNRDDVVNIYSKYAASTKRDSNTQIGAFGLGAKSALAITDRFDVTAVKDGVELVFYCEKKKTGAPHIVFVSENKTKKPNGVTVTIPVKKSTDVSSMTGFATRFFRTWNPETVIYNGETIAENDNVYDSEKYHTIYVGEEIAGWISKIKSVSERSRTQHHGGPEVSISGIGYKIESGTDTASVIQNVFYHGYKDSLEKTFGKAAGALTSLSKWGFRIIVNLPIGSVDLTPSRESIMITEKTTAALEAGGLQLVNTLRNQMISELNRLPQKEAFGFYANHLPAFGVDESEYEKYPNASSKPKNDFGVTYQGQIIPNTVEFNDICIIVANNASSWLDPFYDTKVDLFAAYNGHSPLRGWNTYMNYNHYNHKTAVFVYGERSEKTLAAVKRNARSYSESIGGGKYVTIYFFNSKTKPVQPWLESVTPIVSVEELETAGKAYRSAIAASRKGQGEGKKRPTAIHYGVIFNPKTKLVERRKFSAEEISDAKKVVVVNQDSHSIRAYGANPTNYYLWSDMIVGDNWEDENWGPGVYVNNVAKLFPDAPIIFVPKTRSVNPILKANPKAEELHEAWLAKTQSLLKKKETRSLFDAIASVNLTLKGENQLFQFLHKSGELHRLDNDFTKAVVKSVGEESELLLLVIVARLFFNPHRNDSWTKEVKTYLTHWTESSKEGGWGEKFSFIIPTFRGSYTSEQAAVTIRNLVNALDA